MHKYIAAALVALTAACKPLKKVTGTYVFKPDGKELPFRDTITVKPVGEKGSDRVVVDHKRYFDYGPGGTKDTLSSLDTGYYDRKANAIILDNWKKYPKEDNRFQLNKRKREISRAGDTHRKIRR